MISSAFGRLLLVAAILMIPSAVLAQEATLSGTVTDSTGGVLPGVVVRAVHEASGNSFEGVTDGSGSFRLEVRVGAYRLIAELAGFTTVNRTGLELLVGQQAVVNLQMTPGNAAGISYRDRGSAAPRHDAIEPEQQHRPARAAGAASKWPQLIDLTMLAPGSRLNSVSEVPVSGTGNTVQFQLNLDGQSVTNNMPVGFGQPRCAGCVQQAHGQQLAGVGHVSDAGSVDL